MNIRMNEFSTIIFHSAEEQIIRDAQISEVKSLFRCFDWAKKNKNSTRSPKRFKSEEKTQNFASLVETENQHVLPSNTEKNLREEKQN